MPVDSTLTLVIPTRNRPRHCLAQLRYLRNCGVTHPIIIADSSNLEIAKAIRAQCDGMADYSFTDTSIDFSEKCARAIRAVATPFIVMLPDDDVTFPHAIEASLAHLQEHPDYVAAHGYVLRFGMHGDNVDVHSVFSYTPTIDAERPLYRHYELMRRYQPFFWAVFRTDVLALAMAGAAAVKGLIFQEIAFMSRAILMGKVARLPLIFSMRGMEESLSPAIETDPLLWFLHDSGSFYHRYKAYRDALAAFIRADPRLHSGLPASTAIEHLLDLNHATFFGRVADMGMINHQARLLLGDVLPPIQLNPQWPGWRVPGSDDLIHLSQLGNRRYIWRQSVLKTEPRNEIIITKEEIATVEKQFDAYRLEQG
jgi:glycosyltransferase domain-containing protein